MKALLLAASENRWLREQGVRAPFVRRAVSKFMPGETFDDMIAAAHVLAQHGMRTLFTQLGENVTDPALARAACDHYVEAIERVRVMGVACEPSVKPTQLGLDVDRERAARHLQTIAARAAAAGSYLWIDMEQSPYVDVTLEITERLRASYPAVGVCLQAYLRRTHGDLVRMLHVGAGVRLVKGAYREPPAVAFASKRDVDDNYLALGRLLLDDRARGGSSRIVFGTHDRRLIAALIDHARRTRVARGSYEFHLLYGVDHSEQLRLAAAREDVRVLIAYGTHWFPWYMRRLAERPANVWFVLRSVVR